jgi:hypothetical protein
VRHERTAGAVGQNNPVTTRSEPEPITHIDLKEFPVTNTTSNGQQRKSLASQIDRLDAILDGLSDGLNDAVAAAVQEAVGIAVREAVKAVLTEVLSNPAFLARIRAASPAREKKPGLSARVAAAAARLAPRVRESLARLKGGLGKCLEFAANRLERAKASAGGLIERFQALRRFRRPVLVALGVGTGASVLAYFSGPWAAAAAGWLSGFVTTLAVQAAAALRKLLGASSSSA